MDDAHVAARQALPQKPDWTHPVVPNGDGTISVLKGHPSSKKFMEQLGALFSSLGRNFSTPNAVVSPDAPSTVEGTPYTETIRLPKKLTEEQMSGLQKEFEALGIPVYRIPEDEEAAMDAQDVAGKAGKADETNTDSHGRTAEDLEQAKQAKTVEKPPVHVVFCHSWRTDGRQPQDDDLLVTAISSIQRANGNDNLFFYVMYEAPATDEEKRLCDGLKLRLQRLDEELKALHDTNPDRHIDICPVQCASVVTNLYANIQKHPDGAAVPRLKNVIYLRWLAPRVLYSRIENINRTVGWRGRKKLLYLDIDVIANRDLTTFFLGDDRTPISATQDHYLVWQGRRSKGYVHSALLLYDVDEYLRRRVHERLLAHATSETEKGVVHVFTDQDFLNTCPPDEEGGFIRTLPPQCLAMANVGFYNGGRFTPQDYLRTAGQELPDATWSGIYAAATILHFAGATKPPEWIPNYAYSRWREEYTRMQRVFEVPAFCILIPSTGGERLRGAVTSAERAIEQLNLSYYGHKYGEGRTLGYFAVSIDCDGEPTKEQKAMADWCRRQVFCLEATTHVRSGVGPGSNRNYLMDRLRRNCRYFVWLDDDDRFACGDVLVRLLRAFEERPMRDVAVMGGVFVSGGECSMKCPPDCDTFEEAFSSGMLRQGPFEDEGPFVFLEPWTYAVRSCVRYRFGEELPEDVFGLVSLMDNVDGWPVRTGMCPYLKFMRPDSCSSSILGRLANSAVMYHLMAMPKPRTKLGAAALQAVMRNFIGYTKNTGVGLADDGRDQNDQTNDKEKKNGGD